MPSMVAVPELWLNVRWSSVLPPEPLAPKLSPPLASVTPLPLIVPPAFQVVRPLTVSAPVPVRVDETVKLVIDVSASSVQVPPLLIVASSAAPGTPFGFQFVGVNQSPEATFQL